MPLSKLETLAITSEESGIYHVELNRPETRNAVNMQMWNDFRTAFEELASDSNCRVIVLSARGKSFSAGIDITDPLNAPPPSDDVARKGLKFIQHTRVMQEAFTAIEQCLKPTIAVVHGACVGAGLDLVTAVDIRLCSEDALFSVREVAVGLAADVGSLARLPKIVGSDSWVRDLALTARNCPAAEAKARGLVSDLYSSKKDALAEAMKIASTIASHSPVAVVGTKKNLNYSRDHTVQDSLDYVLTWNASMIQSDDMVKAMMAALQKQKPEFSKL